VLWVEGDLGLHSVNIPDAFVKCEKFNKKLCLAQNEQKMPGRLVHPGNIAKLKTSFLKPNILFCVSSFQTSKLWPHISSIFLSGKLNETPALPWP
jgi:hypothetical protein